MKKYHSVRSGAQALRIISIPDLSLGFDLEDLEEPNISFYHTGSGIFSQCSQ